MSILRHLILPLLAVFAVTSANAQDMLTAPLPEGDFTGFFIADAYEEQTLSQWQRVDGELTAGEMSELLAAEGWVLPENWPANDSEVLAYTRQLSPGVTEFFVDYGQGAPVQFSPELSYVQADQFAAPQSVTRSRVQQQVIAGIESAIEAICSFSAGPQQVQVTASAFGIVEVQATWDAEDVCQ
jgi:hypothetical protein